MTDTIQSAIDKLIAEATDEQPEKQASTFDAPSYAIGSFDGFPALYDGEPEPHGAQWLTTYRHALENTQNGQICSFIGNHGAGKGRMAFEIAKNAKMRNILKPKKEWEMGSCPETRPAIYRTAMEIFIELRSTYSPKADKSEWGMMKDYEKAALLIIDELQVRGETKFEDNKLTSIIDARYRQRRPTILIANLTIDQLASQLSDAVNDRIRGAGQIYQFNWQSYRKQQTK